MKTQNRKKSLYKADLHVKLVWQIFASKTQLLELDMADQTGKRAIKIYLNIHESGIFSDLRSILQV